MLNALPKNWIKSDIPDEPTNKKSKLCFDVGSSSGSVSQIRKYIVNNKYDVPKSVEKWNAYLGNQSFNKTWWTNAEYTKDTKLKSLQYKILHRIYPTNCMLEKMRISLSNKCVYCDEIDSLEHFFFSCGEINCLWKYIENVINIKFGKCCTLSEKDVLFGLDKGNLKYLSYVNIVILIGKLCISKYKYGDKQNLIYLFDMECLLRKIEY